LGKDLVTKLSRFLGIWLQFKENEMAKNQERTTYTLDLGIFPPFGNDHDKNIAFCLDTDVCYVALSARQLARQSSKGIPSTTELIAAKEKYLQDGIKLQALTPTRITFEALADRSVWVTELDIQKSIIKNMGEAGIPLLHIYVSGVQAPEDEKERNLSETIGRLLSRTH